MFRELLLVFALYFNLVPFPFNLDFSLVLQKTLAFTFRALKMLTVLAKEKSPMIKDFWLTHYASLISPKERIGS